MASNYKEVLKDLKNEMDRSKEKASKIMRATAIDLLRYIIFATPVNTGRLRGNWQVGINRPTSLELPIEDKKGPTTLSAGTQKISEFSGEDTAIYICNNLPYAEDVENGSSPKSPPGAMVKANVEIFKPLIEKYAKLEHHIVGRK